jgi:conjugal transfer/entry exclusion protein
MKSKGKNAIAILVLVSLVFSTPARAVLGIGDVVFDPSNYAQAIRSFIQLQQQYAQLISIYQQTRAQYEQMVWMAKTVPVNMRAR